MLAFFWVLIQEAIVGKGCITVIRRRSTGGSHRARRGRRYLLCSGGWYHEHHREPGRRRLLDGRILAELTGEVPASAAPAPADKGFELPA